VRRGARAAGHLDDGRFDRVALALALLAGLLHAAFANRYDVFRDELYFIVCGRHPQFGYADQPPLVPLLAATTYALGGQTWILRLPPVIAAALLPWLVVRFVRLLRGGDGACWLAGVAAVIAPMFLGLTATLNTTSFEPLAWTAIAYGIARAVLLDDRRALLWTGLVAGVELEVKYALPLWLGALAIGLLVTPERRLFRRRELWLGLALALVLALPSLVWQASHGLPFLELVRNAGDKDVAVAPVAFLLNQGFVMNPLLAPLWVAGYVAPFALRLLAPMRFAAIAGVVTAAATIAGHGKDYYLAPIYPTLFALGAVALDRAVRNTVARFAYIALAVGLSTVAAPLALPILAPSALPHYMQALHLAPQAQEREDVRNAAIALPPTFADMVGWRTFVRQVADAYASLPADVRARTSIVVDNYGEAGAIDVLGSAYGLPSPLSGHNQYGLWGTRGQDPRNVLRVQRDVASLKRYCGHVHVIAHTYASGARTSENGKAIAFCENLHPSLETLWPSLRFIE